jgi:uncharacterized protein YktA (UPF0223 family)
MIDLSKIIPRQAKITNKRNGKEFILKPFTIRDELWCRDNLGDDFLSIFHEDDMDHRILYRIAFRLLEDKSEFVAKEIEQINEEGIKEKKMIGGYELFIDLFEGPLEKAQIASAVAETIGLSSPEVVTSESKKKATKK